MLITRHLEEPCPKCGEIGQYGNVNVGGNILNRGCNRCGEWLRYPLPELQKKIIYLDQFFLSHAFRNCEQPFVDVANRIRDMAERQLIVAPYSSVHRDETHLWRHKQQEELYKFIKQTARGYEFNQAYEIKQTQMHRAFDAFRKKSSVDNSIEARDAFREDIHKWDDYFWIDIKPYLGDLEAMRQGKADAIAALVALFPEWATLKTTFEEDVVAEARGYGRSLLDQYLKMVFSVGNDGLLEYLQTPIDTMYVESLLHYDSNTIEIGERIKRISSFFSSEYFYHIPNIRISCGLFAVLRKLVKKGAYSNPENAKKKLKGLFYDSECISVFGPYSDAIFIDREMNNWCEDPGANLFGGYATNVFSVQSWDGFNSYLDQVEKNYSEDIQKALRLVYPGIYA